MNMPDYQINMYKYVNAFCLYLNFIPKQQLNRKLAHQQTTSSTRLYAIIVGLLSFGTVTNTWAYDCQHTVAEVVSMALLL